MESTEEKVSRFTLKTALANVLEIVEANVTTYDPAKDTRRLLSILGEDEAEAVALLVSKKVARFEAARGNYDRVKTASDALCAIEFFVIDQQAKLEAAQAKVKAAK